MISPGIRLLGLAAWLAALCGPAYSGTIRLSDSTGAVSISPSTLEVQVVAPGGRRVVVSAGQHGLGAVTGLRVTASYAAWELPVAGLSVRMQLRRDTLQVDLHSRRGGEITWPVVPARPDVRAYILPTFEGQYVPAHDAGWSRHLAEQGDLSMTADFAMPFWGLDCGRFTLTYLLTPPFHSNLRFVDKAGNLAAQLTHRFMAREQTRDLKFRITLGPASPIEPARRYRQWLIGTNQFVTMQAKIRKVPAASRLLGAPQAYLDGDGNTTQMMDRLKGLGFDRMLLIAEAWHPLVDNPAAVSRAEEIGYLIGPYDSYNSIHSPDASADETWETAQFDRHLYETGPIVGPDGKKRPGFQHKGYLLSPLAARPAVEQRVNRLMGILHCNAWFIDCDAFGQIYDDYSPLHPATEQEDMLARLARMAWIRDRYGVVIGSERGASYAAATVHFVQGMTTPGIGWGDPDLKDRRSPYFLGGYWPPDAPARHFKPVSLKPVYYRYYFDPRYRLPLYEAVFHDSVVATDHPDAPFLKFRGQVVTRTLLSLLYQVPPLYFLNQKELKRHGAWIRAHYAFFSPIHREVGLLPLTDFRWLTPDHLVQRTVFGSRVEMLANFGSRPFAYRALTVPAKSCLYYNRESHAHRVFSPAPLERT